MNDALTTEPTVIDYKLSDGSILTVTGDNLAECDQIAAQALAEMAADGLELTIESEANGRGVARVEGGVV